jgi:hypothetical protein
MPNGGFGKAILRKPGSIAGLTNPYPGILFSLFCTFVHGRFFTVLQDRVTYGKGAKLKMNRSSRESNDSRQHNHEGK